MLGKLLPVLMVLVGLGIGLGAGLALRPAPEEVAQPEEAPAPAPRQPTEPAGDFFRLNNQFIVPVLEDGRITALVILSLSVEVEPGTSDSIFNVEPRLRDAFLQVMFDHANAGGFTGAFTSASTLGTLRSALREAARSILGPTARDVLIIDLVRQDS